MGQITTKFLGWLRVPWRIGIGWTSSTLLAANDLSPFNLLVDMGGTRLLLRDTLSTMPRLLASFSASQIVSGAS